MKSKNILHVIVLLMVMSGFFSCKKEIAVGPPITKLVTSNVFNDNGTATAAQLSIYAQMSDFPYHLHLATGLSSDELYTYNTTDQVVKDTYSNSLGVADASLGGSGILSFWTTSYQYLYQVNAVLEGLQQSNRLSPKVKKQLMGEAEFVRAYYYFYLVNLYGDVPLITGTNYKFNEAVARNPKGLVYQQIVQDLLAAQANLSANYVDATDTTQTTDRIRPTTWAAHALLARAYLYMGNGYYDKAEAEASIVIGNSTLFGLPSDLSTVFKINSTEAIWQIAQYDGSGVVTFTTDGTNFVLTSPPSISGAGSSTISDQLMSTFEVGDQRQAKWIGTYSDGGSFWNYPAKYKDNATSASSTTESTMILRLAEQYLIRAEARVQQSKLTGAGSALEDLNVIRNRAGLSNYTGATDQQSLMAAISHERQVELFAEGDRWFNLKRSGIVDAIMGGGNGVTAAKGGTWNSYQQLYPIPQSELLIDNNLKQNPGY